MSIDDADAELENWARWTRHESRPALDIPEPPAFEFWRPHGDAREPGWGDATPGDRILDAIDRQAAELTEYVLVRLHVREFVCLRRHYHQKKTQPEIELQQALRAYMDTRAAVQKRLDPQKKTVSNDGWGTLVPKFLRAA